MAKLFFNISSFGTIKMCPMPNEVCQVQNFPEYQIIFPNIAQDFLIFAKVAKFRQIWSHWVYQPKCQIILPNIAKDFLIFAKVAKFCQICSLWFEFTTYLSTVSSHNPWSASVCLIPSAHNIQFCCNIQLLFCHFALFFFSPIQKFGHTESTNQKEAGFGWT